MSIHLNANSTMAQRRAAIERAISELTSDRKVRKIVTPFAKRVRGIFPTLKSQDTRATFDSGFEVSVLAIAEVALSVKKIKTHPYVLRLGGVHYTPDVEIDTAQGPAILEAKGSVYLRRPNQVHRHKTICRHLAQAGIPFATMLTSDVPSELIDEIEVLLAERPWPKCGGRGFVPGEIAGLDTSLCTQDFISRWIEAGRECDALIARLMLRGADDTISAAAQ
jgi:hypothetical protein